ncbi:hypothetical protein KGZ04_24835, partial [Pseudomonas aeruginosa]|uniref:hypothetical protein n=1 Tax=Pseudomonas aeruginosa TaxID=287 RepID=UPI0023420A1B
MEIVANLAVWLGGECQVGQMIDWFGSYDRTSRPLKNSASTAPTRPVWRFFKRFGLTESTQGLTSGLFDRF